MGSPLSFPPPPQQAAADFQQRLTNAADKYIEQEIARRSLFSFTSYTKDDYEPNWHHEYLCTKLDEFLDGKIRRLIIMMPPRHGKTEHVSRRFPAYAFGRNPNIQIISCSYGAALAQQINRDVQRIMDSEQYLELFPDTRLNSENIRTVAYGQSLRNSDLFEIVGKKGFYRGAGIGGGITGMGFHIGIIDDPIKNREEAESEVFRENIWEWYTSTFYTRREKDAGILVVQTRWHEDDLTGRLLKQMLDNPGAEEWTVIDFPAIKEDDHDPADPRKVGEALWRNKYDEKELKQTEITIGQYDFSALYQQHPTPASGGVIKPGKIKLIEVAPLNFVRLVRGWDLAYTEDDLADYTVGLLLGLTLDNRYVILDINRTQIDLDFLSKHIKQVAVEDGPAVVIGVETAFFGTRIGKQLYKDPDLNGYTIVRYRPDTDKVTRALPIAARIENGFVDAMNRGWFTSFKIEAAAFPYGAHDDQIDALTVGEKVIEQLPRTTNIIDVYGMRSQLGTVLRRGAPALTPGEMVSSDDLYRIEYERRDRRAQWLRLQQDGDLEDDDQ